jgi:hypothetical protein
MKAWSVFKTGWKCINGTYINQASEKLVSTIVPLDTSSRTIASKFVSPLMVLFGIIVVQNCLILGISLPLLHSSEHVLKSTTVKRKSDSQKIQIAVQRTEIAKELLQKSSTVVVGSITVIVLLMYARTDSVRISLQKI